MTIYGATQKWLLLGKNRCNSVDRRSGAGLRDTLVHPGLDLGFEPCDAILTEGDALWEIPGLHVLVDGRGAAPSDFLDGG